MGHGDGLNADPATWCQTLVQCAEIGGPPPLPDCLDHFDTDDGVEGACRISVVLLPGYRPHRRIPWPPPVVEPMRPVHWRG